MAKGSIPYNTAFTINKEAQMGTAEKAILLVLFLVVDFGIAGPFMVSHRSYELPIIWGLINTILLYTGYRIMYKKLNKKKG